MNTCSSISRIEVSLKTLKSSKFAPSWNSLQYIYIFLIIFEGLQQLQTQQNENHS